VNKAFGYAVDELLYGSDEGAGILPDSASDTVVLRLPDQGGVPVFHVQSVVDGRVYNGKLSARDVYSLAAKREARRRPADAIVQRNLQDQMDIRKRTELLLRKP
jgi:hypothetical protein